MEKKGKKRRRETLAHREFLSPLLNNNYDAFFHKAERRGFRFLQQEIEFFKKIMGIVDRGDLPLLESLKRLHRRLLEVLFAVIIIKSDERRFTELLHLIGSEEGMRSVLKKQVLIYKPQFIGIIDGIDGVGGRVFTVKKEAAESIFYLSPFTIHGDAGMIGLIHRFNIYYSFITTFNLNKGFSFFVYNESSRRSFNDLIEDCSRRVFIIPVSERYCMGLLKSIRDVSRGKFFDGDSEFRKFTTEVYGEILDAEREEIPFSILEPDILSLYKFSDQLINEDEFMMFYFDLKGEDDLRSFLNTLEDSFILIDQEQKNRIFMEKIKELAKYYFRIQENEGIITTLYEITRLLISKGKEKDARILFSVIANLERGMEPASIPFVQSLFIKSIDLTIRGKEKGKISKVE